MNHSTTHIDGECEPHAYCEQDDGRYSFRLTGFESSTVYLTCTPEQARSFAAGIVAAADDAERRLAEKDQGVLLPATITFGAPEEPLTDDEWRSYAEACGFDAEGKPR